MLAKREEKAVAWGAWAFFLSNTNERLRVLMGVKPFQSRMCGWNCTFGSLFFIWWRSLQNARVENQLKRLQPHTKRIARTASSSQEDDYYCARPFYMWQRVGGRRRRRKSCDLFRCKLRSCCCGCCVCSWQMSKTTDPSLQRSAVRRKARRNQ